MTSPERGAGPDFSGPDLITSESDRTDSTALRQIRAAARTSITARFLLQREQILGGAR